MAFVYCEKCNWQQDDFWSFYFKPQWKFWRWRSVFGYNPIACFLEVCNSYILPRWIGFDSSFVEDMKRWGHKPYYREIFYIEPINIEADVTNINSNSLATKALLEPEEDKPIGYRERKRAEIFSWWMLWHGFVMNYRKFKKAHWFTESRWRKDSKKWACPHCDGKLQID